MYRLMREGNLLCLRGRKFVTTTHASHDRPAFPNLASGMVLTEIDQLWVGDTKYIRLSPEFVWLAGILEAYARGGDRVGAGSNLGVRTTITALRMTLDRRILLPGLVQRSDRGVPYALQNYPNLQESRGVTISMSRKGNPFDHVACESFMKTLKYEKVHRQEHRDLVEARASIEDFLEQV